MINNLFSIFDPSSSYFSSCWLILVIAILILSNRIWFTKPSFLRIYEKVIRLLYKEISFTIGKSKKRESFFILSLFLLILLINRTALFPQIFSVSSHLTVTLPLAVISWLIVNLFGWIKNTNHILAHLVPQGTPTALISFIVIIELTRNLIRPITLCVRLTANIIAGHLLITLLGNAILSVRALSSILLLFTPLILTVLETAVAVIQSYVFITLITLYTTEVK